MLFNVILKRILWSFAMHQAVHAFPGGQQGCQH